MKRAVAEPGARGGAFDEVEGAADVRATTSDSGRVFGWARKTHGEGEGTACVAMLEAVEREHAPTASEIASARDEPRFFERLRTLCGGTG